MTERPAKLLIADDNTSIQNILRRLLRRHDYWVQTAEDGEAALALAMEWLPDLILLDVMMPRLDGLEVCRRLKSNPKYHFIYVIMLTARSDAEDEVAGLDTGADDYIAKPFQPETLMARIRKGLRQMSDRVDAAFDPLTGLYNRRSFEAFYRQEVAKSKRYRAPLSLILVDLDHFKQVNDTHGHQAGDRVLATVAEILQQATREADLASRWGGEEMALLLPETDGRGARVVAEKLRERIAAQPFEDVGRVTASFGVATLEGPYVDLVSEADQALYRAKAAGRNRVDGPVKNP
jgi:diguanylate cyclase (GGDEF)-like protein